MYPSLFSGLIRSLFILLITGSLARAVSLGPNWWYDRGVILPGAEPHDYAALTQGQLKAMAAAARDELDEKLTGGSGSAIDNLVDGWSVPTSSTNDSAIVNIGQLKAVAKLFYDRLDAAGYDIPSHLKSYGYPSTWSHDLPWDESASGSSKRDFAAANVGQMKMVFSFDFFTPDPFDEDVMEDIVGANVLGRKPRLIGLPDQTDAFSNGLANGLPIDEGRLFSTGGTTWAGPNLESSTTIDWNLPGDDDLTATAYGNVISTFDASGIVFEFRPTYSNVSITFVFASEEYWYYVGAYDDAMAIYVDGVCISNTPPPDSHTVGTGSINEAKNDDLFIANYWESPSYNVIYNGYTVELTCNFTVQPQRWHSLKIVIADANDHILDSAVFIKKNSLISTP